MIWEVTEKYTVQKIQIGNASNLIYHMSYFTNHKMRMFCEKMVDGQWTVIKKNGIIAYRDEELDSFCSNCVDEIYNISTAWVECKSDILGDELKALLEGMSLRTMRLSELWSFIQKSCEGMYGAVTIEAIRNTQRGQNDYVQREAFDLALSAYSELKIIEHDAFEILGERLDYIEYADSRIVWVEQKYLYEQ